VQTVFNCVILFTEFLDETDDSLNFVLFGGDAIPIAILDVGMSNYAPEQKSKQEFLICFHTLGIFVDVCICV
jgi:hypothetical protein